jgi:hypothetical protein
MIVLNAYCSECDRLPDSIRLSIVAFISVPSELLDIRKYLYHVIIVLLFKRNFVCVEIEIGICGDPVTHRVRHLAYTRNLWSWTVLSNENNTTNCYDVGLQIWRCIFYTILSRLHMWNETKNKIETKLKQIVLPTATNLFYFSFISHVPPALVTFYLSDVMYVGLKEFKKSPLENTK